MSTNSIMPPPRYTQTHSRTAVNNTGSWPRGRGLTAPLPAAWECSVLFNELANHVSA